MKGDVIPNANKSIKILFSDKEFRMRGSPQNAVFMTQFAQFISISIRMKSLRVVYIYISNTIHSCHVLTTHADFIYTACSK